MFISTMLRAPMKSAASSNKRRAWRRFMIRAPNRKSISIIRAGDLVVFSDPDAWFTYYYWLEESHAPDFAHTVDIHRKPGYDPVELFIDPKIRLPKLRIATRC